MLQTVLTTLIFCNSLPGESNMDCQTNTMAPCPKIPGYAQKKKQAIISFFSANCGDGYRRCAYVMTDEDVAYASPSTVYRVLKEAGMLQKKADDIQAVEKVLNNL
jgi:hypothetical protein